MSSTKVSNTEDRASIRSGQKPQSFDRSSNRQNRLLARLALCLPVLLVLLSALVFTSCAAPEKVPDAAMDETPAVEADATEELGAMDYTGETRVVEATGVAAITAAGPAKARDGAIADALRKAVEQAVGTMVSSETMVENYAVLSDNVYTRSTGYVKDYEVLGETPGMDLYQVRVRATVALGKITDDLSALGLLIRKAGMPRVLFMIAEKNVGKKFYTFWWWGQSEYRGEVVDMSAAETSLKEIFLNKGFHVVDMSASTGTFEIKDQFRVADLTREATVSIGRDLEADVVVYGRATVTEGPRTPGSNVVPYLADITAQVVRVDDGVVLGSTTGHASYRHISSVSGGTIALKKAAEDISDRLIEQISARWMSSMTVTITIRGVAGQDDVAEFKRLLNGRVRGIEGIYQRRLEGSVAVIEVETKSSAQDIADDISRVDGGPRVTGTTTNTVEVTYGP